MKKYKLAMAIALFSAATSLFATPEEAKVEKTKIEKTSTSKQKKVETISPEQNNKNISYMVGYRLGLEVVGVDLEILDNKEIIAGVEDALARKNMKLTPQELKSASATLNQELNKAEAKRAKAYIEYGKKYLADNAKRKDVITTASGLQYEVLSKGTGDTPKATDIVTVKYEGRFIDGTTFDSSANYGDSSEFAVNMVIPAWVEMLQLMHVGEKVRLYAPSELAYGNDGKPPVIRPNTVLVFDLELVDINKPADNVDVEKAKEEAKVEKSKEEPKEEKAK